MESAPDVPPAAANDNESLRGQEYVLSACVLLFGIVIVGIVLWIMYRRQQDWGDATFQAFTLPLVVFAGLFLITAGYDQHQVAPMFGLLGTLVGYILGKNQGQPAPVTPTPKPSTVAENQPPAPQ